MSIFVFTNTEWVNGVATVSGFSGVTALLLLECRGRHRFLCLYLISSSLTAKRGRDKFYAKELFTLPLLFPFSLTAQPDITVNISDSVNISKIFPRKSRVINEWNALSLPSRRSWSGIFQARSDSSSVSERPRTTVPDGLLHPGLRCWHWATSASCQPSSTCSSSTLTVVGIWNSLPDFTRDPAMSTDCFRRVLILYLFARYYCIQRIMGILDDNALYKFTYLLTVK